MKHALIYRFWSEKEELDYSNIKEKVSSPLIPAIATLRSHNKKIPIYVLDYSEKKIEWDVYPELLDFAVISSRISGDYTKKVERYSIIDDRHPIMGRWSRVNYSRLFDIWNFGKTIEEDVIIYSDADVFWTKDPLPLFGNTNKFCWNSWNSGVYYYDKNSAEVELFFELLFAYGIVGLVDWNFTIQNIKPACAFPVRIPLYDEPLLHFMTSRYPELISTIPPEEHFLFRQSLQYPRPFSPLSYKDKTTCNFVPNKHPKNFHCNGFGIFDINRAMICLIFEELKKSMQDTLGSHAQKLFGDNAEVETIVFKEIWNDKEFLNRFIHNIHSYIHKLKLRKTNENHQRMVL